MNNLLSQVQVLEDERRKALNVGNNVLAGQLTETIKEVSNNSEYCFALAYYLAWQTGEPYYVVQVNRKDWSNDDGEFHCVNQRELDTTLGDFWKRGMISQLSKCCPPQQKSFS